MRNRIAVIGIDIGGTKISAALFVPDGNILEKEIRHVGDRKGKQVFDLISALVLSLIDYAKKASYKVKAIGVGVPGIYNHVGKTVWAPNISEWDSYPLWGQLTLLVNDPSVKVVIESDRSCYILGEVWKGHAQECTDAIFIAVGTGIGAGILSNGRIISGNSGIAGAIGWMALQPPYDKKYDTLGNLEHYASGNGIARNAIETLRKVRTTNSLLDAIPIDEITSQNVFDVLEKQDTVALEVIDKAVQYWGMAVANLVSIFNPQKIIFGGGVFGPATQFLNRILGESKKWAQPMAMEEISLEASSLQGDAGLIGAGYLAIKSIKIKING